MLNCAPLGRLLRNRLPGNGCHQTRFEGTATVWLPPLHVMIAREGFEVNHKKVRRIYREEKLQVRRRGGRKRALGTRKPMEYRMVRTNAGAWISCLTR